MAGRCWVSHISQVMAVTLPAVLYYFYYYVVCFRFIRFKAWWLRVRTVYWEVHASYCVAEYVGIMVCVWVGILFIVPLTSFPRDDIFRDIRIQCNLLCANVLRVSLKLERALFAYILKVFLNREVCLHTKLGPESSVALVSYQACPWSTRSIVCSVTERVLEPSTILSRILTNRVCSWSINSSGLVCLRNGRVLEQWEAFFA
jgi:hypothetical protein